MRRGRSSSGTASCDANLDEVAQRAGVAKGTLYRYFENKGELYVAVLSHNGALFEQRMREAAASAARPAGADPPPRPLLPRALDRPPRVLPDLLGDREPGGDRRASAGGRRRGDEALGAVPAHPGRRDPRRRRARAPSAPATSGSTAHVLWTAANGLIQSELTAARRATLQGRAAAGRVRGDGGPGAAGLAPSLGPSARERSSSCRKPGTGRDCRCSRRGSSSSWSRPGRRCPLPGRRPYRR